MSAHCILVAGSEAEGPAKWRTEVDAVPKGVRRSISENGLRPVRHPERVPCRARRLEDLIDERNPAGNREILNDLARPGGLEPPTLVLEGEIAEVDGALPQ
jgi:hypothetical protein